MGPPPGITWMSVATVLVSAVLGLGATVPSHSQAGTGQFPPGSQPWSFGQTAPAFAVVLVGDLPMEERIVLILYMMITCNSCMYIYIYTYTHTHTYIYIHIYTYPRICVCTYLFAFIRGFLPAGKFPSHDSWQTTLPDAFERFSFCLAGQNWSARLRVGSKHFKTLAPSWTSKELQMDVREPTYFVHFCPLSQRQII